VRKLQRWWTLAAGALAVLALALPAASSAAVPARLYFNGSFGSCALTAWRDFHDAALGSAPPGFGVEREQADGSCYAKVSVTDGPSTSTSGDISYLWEGNGSNDYSLPWMQSGAEAWFRMRILFPNGRDPAYPGVFHVAPLPRGWDFFEEWHEPVEAGYSTIVGVHGGSTGAAGRDPNVLTFVPTGGTATNQTFTNLYQRNRTRSRIPLRYNHWYDILVHLVFGSTPQTGLAQWWVDGVLQDSVHVPTITSVADGSTPGVSHQVGLYRGPSETYVDTVYIDAVADGPTRASVGNAH
jgi:hypothetical protein